MEDSEGVETWVEAGVRTSVHIIPDHQLTWLQDLSEDSVRLFRISLVVLSIYASAFGFVLNSGSQFVTQIVSNPFLLFTAMVFLISLGGSMVAYRISRSYLTNSMKASDYINILDRMYTGNQKGISDEDLLYKYYWRKSVEISGPLKQIQIIVYFSGYCLYNAVVYAPLGLIDLYISYPDWVLLVAVVAPLMIPILFSVVASWFWESDGPIFVRGDEVEYEEQ